MKKVISLARKGEGIVSPNPLVGAVIVNDGRVVGRGFHCGAGEAHAEVEAIRDCERRGVSVAGTDLYVNLEPCSHYGRTPPCVESIISAGIKRVFVGCLDPDERNRGRGIRVLRDKGVDVQVGILLKECVLLNEAFFMSELRHRPLVYMKYAMTVDGKLASEVGDSKWISNEKSRRLSHRLRRRVDAIIVGVGTVLADDPRLTFRGSVRTVRVGDREKIQPYRVVVDPVLQIPDSAAILDKEPGKTIIFSCKGKRVKRVARLRDRGARVIELDEVPLTASSMLRELHRLEARSVLVEGGGKTQGQFFLERLVDRLEVYIGPMALGGDTAPVPFGGEGILRLENSVRFSLEKIRKIDNDVRVQYLAEDYRECLQDWFKKQAEWMTFA